MIRRSNEVLALSPPARAIAPASPSGLLLRYKDWIGQFGDDKYNAMDLQADSLTPTPLSRYA